MDICPCCRKASGGVVDQNSTETDNHSRQKVTRPSGLPVGGAVAYSFELLKLFRPEKELLERLSHREGQLQAVILAVKPKMRRNADLVVEKIAEANRPIVDLKASYLRGMS